MIIDGEVQSFWILSRLELYCTTCIPFIVLDAIHPTRSEVWDQDITVSGGFFL